MSMDAEGSQREAKSQILTKLNTKIAYPTKNTPSEPSQDPVSHL